MVFTVCVLVSLYRRQRRKVPPVLPPPQSFATWITDSSDVVRKLPLNQVAFPGSHNSGAYNICGNVVSGDCHASLVPYIQRLPFVSSFCQRLSITEQLQAGVRYLDIRVQAFPSGAPRVCHSLCSISLHECIAQVRAFLDEHPTELVILDVNHIYVTSPMVPTARPVDLLGHLNVLTFVRPLLIHALLWLQQLAEQRGDLPTLSAVNIVMVDDCGIDQYAVIAAILNLNKAKTG
ncbi:hypothetical protein DYB34_007822 [Aphanomyces astaci]|uniref:Phosphatidylinositol-specific phospholipase C X domain-containing protein n=1 Tax=Aphanomyces astaci TaxID=112090 RepID=A0A418BLC1_APHAT|nr:hypothetical protein DYB34_007822 [Aphanomyces astaci]